MGSVYLALTHTQTHTRAHIHIYSTIPGVWRLFFMLIARYLSLWSSEFILQLTSECLQDDNGLIGTLSPSGFCWGTTSSSMWISARLCHAGDFMGRHVTWRTSCGHLLLLHSVVCKHIFLLPLQTGLKYSCCMWCRITFTSNIYNLVIFHCKIKHPITKNTIKTRQTKLTPIISVLVLGLLPLLLFLLSSLSRTARNLCQRVCISLSHMRHHWQGEDSAGGRCLCRFTLRQLSRHRWRQKTVDEWKVKKIKKVSSLH